MKNVIGYFENFAFRYFNLWDRASRAEFWVVMPVIWALILLALFWDVQEFWQFLLRREVPPLNPLYYESIVLFVITAMPRLSLTVRRLHDSGRSGKWATLPVTSLVSGLVLLIGLGGALLSSGMSSLNDDQIQVIGIGFVFAALVAGQMETFWQGAFATAALLNGVGWDTIWAVFAEAVDNAKSPEVGQAVAALRDGINENRWEGGQLMIAMISMVATPFVAAFMYLFFMLLPSDDNTNAFGESGMAPITGPARKKKPSNDLLAGYACLFERTPEEKEAHRAAQQAEVKALYRSRVLGHAE